MSKVTIDEFVGFVEKMPAFPRSVHKILQLSSDMNATTKEIVEVIESDPIMTLKILKVINSALYSLPRKVTSIQRALVYLGINTLKNLALSIAAVGILNSDNKAGFNIEHFLEHSVVTAILTKKLAERLHISLMECSDYFVAGLLHDFGKIVFSEFMPLEFKQALTVSQAEGVDLHDVELAYIGLSHDTAGQLLALKWQLSENLANAIKRHHCLTTVDTADSCLVECLFAANQMAKKYALGDSGNHIINEFPEKIQARFAMSLDELMNDTTERSVLKLETRHFMGL